jgi:hypothetical protein
MARRSNEGDSDEGLSLFARAMQQRGRPARVIDFPGLDGVRVALWCPTDDEETQADVESRKYLTKQMGLSALELSLAQETELAKRSREIELLALVLRDPTDPAVAFCESSDDLRGGESGGLEADQRKALMAAIEDFKRERFRAKTPEEAAEIVELLKSLKAVGALSSYWTSCDSDTQEFIVHTLVEALPKPTEPSSSGT